MTEATPRLAIGLPVHNGENYVADAIRSLQAQTFDDFEIVVSDNASTDDTEKIVRDLAADDPRIRYLRSDENVGANRNFNRTFSFARSELFKWAAHDDVVDPTYLERCVSILDDDPGVVLAHTATSYIGSDGAPLVELARGYVGADGYVERLMLDDSVAEQLGSPDVATRFDAVVNRMTVFYDVFGVGRAEAFRNTLLLRQYYGADKVFLAEMALEGRVVRHPDPLFHRRCHQSASTRTSDLSRLASWSDPARRFAYYPLQMISGYADAVAGSGLSAAEKRRCRIALARRLRSPSKLLRGH